MIWIADNDDDAQPAGDRIEHDLDQLYLDDPEQLQLAAWVVHMRLMVMSGLFDSLSELMDPETNPDIQAADVQCLRQLIQATDAGVSQVSERWDLD